MKKLYTINNSEFGIDFDKVLCFYLKDKGFSQYRLTDNYIGRNLMILIGNSNNQPNEMILEYSYMDYVYPNNASEKIIEEVDKLYKDLIEYYKK